MTRVSVQTDAFDAGAELNAFTVRAAGAGAVVSFSGLVRDVDGGLRHMEIEHYPGMTGRAIEEMVETAIDRFALTEAMVIHRHGRLAPGESIMMVATAAPHRADAFAAAEYLMDYLKSRAPFWKKEVTDRGEAWVESKDADEDALSRW
ncbi:molybdenum cofactor biosynthesis protein MoaE [Histidinibacterium aquaticum]|uniref:Molybdopterin synthase catalytic subunit n=1 Tax=Histidinibacterium aquaticum TaxID=2613962 RepID=A0A5J5GB15_9RHOB|nr:molybdenum cofactor biosynthesis protein MoaE [Histidinibacterium aquaticum]KAA9005297.1 molybdenum cofactor biosynthesis protein MoaE [Histidinibacterium aquaticum]